MQALLLLRTINAPPRSGSLQEWVLLEVLDRQEDIEHARFRALAQLIVDKAAGVDAFESYMHTAFPGLAAKKKRDADAVKEKLKSWVNEGPVAITPQSTGLKKVSSRIRRHFARTHGT